MNVLWRAGQPRHALAIVHTMARGLTRACALAQLVHALTQTKKKATQKAHTIAAAIEATRAARSEAEHARAVQLATEALARYPDEAELQLALQVGEVELQRALAQAHHAAAQAAQRRIAEDAQRHAQVMLTFIIVCLRVVVWVCRT